VKRFPVFPSDDVASLLERTYKAQLELFYELIGAVASGKPLPTSDEKWTRKPFSRKEFNQLFIITPEMSQEEIAKRTRAVKYKHWRPYIVLGDYTFELKTDDDN
jgi:hypothetical protein